MGFGLARSISSGVAIQRLYFKKIRFNEYLADLIEKPEGMHVKYFAIRKILPFIYKFDGLGKTTGKNT
jgi:hypothetical protein